MRLLFLLPLAALALAAPSGKAPAEGCVQGQNCIEPACRCSSTAPPGVFEGLDVSQIPQLVFLTFDESVTVSNYPNYTYILGNRVNPNGCPITMTFNVIHDFTDYVNLNALYKRGNEIGIHSISRKTDLDYWEFASVDTWVAEMDGLRTILNKWANIKVEDLKGSRAPFLQPGGDSMIQGLIQSGLQFDMSFPTRNYVDPPMYPYTLDYRTTQDCAIGPCPTESFPGFWISPMVNLLSTGDQYCAMADSCPLMPTSDDQFNFLLQNFQRHYNSNRAPFGIYAHGAWFQENPHILEGYVRFLDEIIAYGDVYVVSVQKGIEWMKNPVDLANAAAFPAFTCPPILAPCSPNVCEYTDVQGPETGGDRLVRGCLNTCPPNYPWVGNPEGA